MKKLMFLLLMLGVISMGGYTYASKCNLLPNTTKVTLSLDQYLKTNGWQIWNTKSWGGLHHHTKWYCQPFCMDVFNTGEIVVASFDVERLIGKPSKIVTKCHFNREAEATEECELTGKFIVATKIHQYDPRPDEVSKNGEMFALKNKKLPPTNQYLLVEIHPGYPTIDFATQAVTTNKNAKSTISYDYDTPNTHFIWNPDEHSHSLWGGPLLFNLKDSDVNEYRNFNYTISGPIGAKIDVSVNGRVIRTDTLTTVGWTEYTIDSTNFKPFSDDIAISSEKAIEFQSVSATEPDTKKLEGAYLEKL